ncbi:probable inactive peptidyl-prolyl cis-trans isomerase-like 6 isoform X1 [Pezoporus wallicus]|uniref:probable inactive peptidyl-prolyl cis-trans isomerase-like 6 isoform X1 n=1 Tax=Pezoporus wallicus TaxID=35540 RepID=UPI00254C56CB|nr:probable inactive peptidyl-prolyl cis-trans isomerase-like 6 isoform X1 [Pezoporus wallicus]XP_061316121.1 probable inactive peptidyl-prolyl cis-trans isomerase-like 6 isoform X2 [Pezoporus flaviventris]
MGRQQMLVTVVGLLQDTAFHMAKCMAEALKLKFPSKFADPVIQPLVEFAWHEYLQEKKKHVFVYLEIAIEEQLIGRLIFELFSDACPRTCENFRALCIGGAKSRCDGRELTYKNSLFHRIVKNGWIQGGDIITGKGDQGESIYGPTFEDESFSVHHKGRGILGMANKGRHTNGSQFYITFQPSPYLDKKYVAFGQLIEGTEVLQRLEAVPTDNERPKVPCKITNCGTFEP